MEKSNKRPRSQVCGREITQGDYDSYKGMCWECWDDQLTEESDNMFDYLI